MKQMKNLKYIISGLFVAGVLVSSAQNQPHLNQYMMQKSFINAASAISSNQTNVGLFYKNQWAGFDGAPTIGGLNLFGNIDKKHYIGFDFNSDNIGVNNSSAFYASYTYKLQVAEDADLGFGLSAGFNFIQSNYAEIKTKDVDPLFAGNTPTFATPNFKFSTFYQKKDKYYVGLAIPNLMRNEIVYTTDYAGKSSFDTKNFHYYLNGGYYYKINWEMKLEGATLIKYAAGAPVQADINAILHYDDKYAGGLGFRTSKDLLVMLNFQIAEGLKLGYAYEYNMGKIKPYSGGSHEVMLVYKFKAKPEVKENEQLDLQQQEEEQKNNLEKPKEETKPEGEEKKEEEPYENKLNKKK